MTALAGYGLILNLDVYIEKRKTPSCDHPERNGQRFCPACGQRVQSFTQRYSSDKHEAFIDFVNTPDNLGALSCHYIEGDEEWFLGWAWMAEDETMKVAPDELPESPEVVWAEIEKVLQPWPELIDRDRFGFHIIDA